MLWFGSTQHVSCVTENRSECVVEIERDSARKLQRTVQLLFLRQVDFDGRGLSLRLRRTIRVRWREKLKQIQRGTIATYVANARVERRDRNSFAAQFER